MAVLLLGSHVKAGVAARLYFDPTPQGHAGRGHDIGQSLQADRAVEPAGGEIARLDAELTPPSCRAAARTGLRSASAWRSGAARPCSAPAGLKTGRCGKS